MGLETGWIRYGDEGVYSGYAARWAGVDEPQPAVIVLQEIWGVDEHIQDVTRRFAQAGYAAFAPDLYARHGERPAELQAGRIEEAKRFLNTLPQSAWGNPDARRSALERLPADRRQAVSETLDSLFSVQAKMPEFKAQTLATAVFLRDAYPYSSGRGMASVGFCMGGALSFFLASADPALKGAVVFYGSPPPADAVSRFGCPVIGFFGGADPRITDAVPAFAEAMEREGKAFEYLVYEDAPHAFFNDTRPSFRAAASRDAYLRTLQFLHKVLVG